MVDFHNRWSPPLVVAKNDIEEASWAIWSQGICA